MSYLTPRQGARFWERRHVFAKLAKASYGRLRWAAPNRCETTKKLSARKEGHNGGDAFGGRHEKRRRERDAQAALGVERCQELRLDLQGEISIAGRETSTGAKALFNGPFTDACARGIRSFLNGGRGSRIKRHAKDRVGGGSKAQLTFKRHAHGHGQKGRLGGTVQESRDGVSGQLKHRALKADDRRPFIWFAIRDLKRQPRGTWTRELKAALSRALHHGGKLGRILLPTIAHVAQNLTLGQRRQLKRLDRLLHPQIATLGERRMGRARHLGLVHRVDMQAIDAVGGKVAELLTGILKTCLNLSLR